MLFSEIDENFILFSAAYATFSFHDTCTVHLHADTSENPPYDRVKTIFEKFCLGHYRNTTTCTKAAHKQATNSPHYIHQSPMHC